MSHVDRLALVSRLLLDHRLLELRQENEELKLKLFWKDHDTQSLKQVMANCNYFGIKCKCGMCMMSGRMEGMEAEESHGGACSFKPWFEGILAKHGMTTITGVRIDQEASGFHQSYLNGPVYDTNAHFFHLTQDDWFFWQYRAKIWKAKTVTDPELMKLQDLFLELDAFIKTIE